MPAITPTKLTEFCGLENFIKSWFLVLLCEKILFDLIGTIKELILQQKKYFFLVLSELEKRSFVL